MLGQVTVIGCGLIGGSIVKSLTASKTARLSVIDREEVLAAVRPLVADVATIGSLKAREIVAHSDLVVLAAPVGVIIESLGSVLDAIAPHTVVTDTGSAKRAVLAAANRSGRRARFVAGHPMAGREIGGFEASSPALFEGARWFLVTEGQDGGPDEQALARVADLARTVGAEPITIDAQAHDRAMAFVSHTPQLVASALYALAAKNGALSAAGPGFRDMTRIAGGPPSMWRDIFQANRQEIAAALRELLAELAPLADDPSPTEGETALEKAVALLERAQIAKGTYASAAAEGGAKT